MLPRLTVLRRQIGGIRKSRKVADEAMFGAGQDGAVLALPHNHHHHETDRRGHEGHGWITVFSVIYRIVRAPFSVLSCFGYHHGNGSYGADGIWVTGGTVRSSEMELLMVSDSMRYAILL
ncbi:hypothetical protein Ancab_010828 [Ancistrocladus abbreviatus]